MHMYVGCYLILFNVDLLSTCFCFNMFVVVLSVLTLPECHVEMLLFIVFDSYVCRY